MWQQSQLEKPGNGMHRLGPDSRIDDAAQRQDIRARAPTLAATAWRLLSR
jgi:hypothetical protein